MYGAGPEPAYLTGWLPGTLLMGTGVGVVFPTLASAAAADLPDSHFAVGSAVTVMSRQLGGVLGVGIFMVLLAGVPQPGATADTTFHAGWTFIALLALVAGVVSCALTPKRRPVTRPT